MSQEEMATIREMLAASGGAAGLTVEQRREAMAAMTDALPIPGATVVEESSGPAPGNWVSVPESRSDRVFLYLHGGAYIAGGPETHTSLVSALCSSSEAKAFVAKYRLAPENPYPAAVEDAVAAYGALLSAPELADFGEDAPRHVVVAGDSAGGGLTLAMLLSARSQGLPMPAAAVCMSPWADLSCSGVGYETRAESDPITDGSNIAEIAELYLDGTDSRDPLASPAFADLTGLPPFLIQVGSDEVLVGDSLLLEARAHACGVPATLEIWAGMVHVWQAFHPMLSEGRDALDRIGTYLHAHWPQ